MRAEAQYWKEHVVDLRTEEEKKDRYGELVSTDRLIDELYGRSYKRGSLNMSIQDQTTKKLQRIVDKLEDAGYTVDYAVVDHISSPGQAQKHFLLEEYQQNTVNKVEAAGYTIDHAAVDRNGQIQGYVLLKGSGTKKRDCEIKSVKVQ